MVEKPGTTASLNSIRVAPSSRSRPTINWCRRKRSRCCPSPTVARANSLLTRVSLLSRSDQERARWGWSHANHLRRAFAGDVATREFTLTPLLAIAAVLAERGITDFHKLSVVSPIEIGHWLHADALV